MKQFNKIKSVQIMAEAVLALAAIFLLLQPSTKQYIFSEMPATLLFFIVWISLLVHFIFLLFDFRCIANMKQDYHSLYSAAYADSLGGIPNRFSCDTIIEKYIDHILPPTVGCAVIDLTNLMQVNADYDHATGNKLLKEFSGMLTASAASLCFVGRNGGNKFLAIFENCSREEADLFLARLRERVEKHNAEANEVPIEYKTGVAINSVEHLTEITRLISLANKRVYQTREDVVSVNGES